MRSTVRWIAAGIAVGYLVFPWAGRQVEALPPAGVEAENPADPTLYGTPAGEELAFGVKEGDLRNYFHRRGTVAVHLLTRSGRDPRLIAAFPAGNQGIGVWFLDPGADAQLWAGAAAGPDEDVSAGGGLTAVVREEGERDMHGVRATLRSDATRLTAYLALLANVRTLRDYGYGLCLENANQFPELRNERIELIEQHDVVRVRREQIGGGHAMELLIQGRQGTTVSVREDEVPARQACQATADELTETVIELSGEGGVQADVILLSDEEPLTPIDRDDLLTETPEPRFELDALAFLSFAEKLEAGSWRFLTYFGRDTLLATRMLMPGLRREVVEAALTSVLERINLQSGLTDPGFEFEIERGEVAHEEELGDFAAWKNSMLETPPDDLRAPRYDYKMVDDDFLLGPALVDYLAKLRAELSDGGQADAAFEEFLSRVRPDGATFREALLANLDVVIARARPFAEDPAEPAAKLQKLVALKENVPVGQWRDSDMGLAFGRFAFDVNVALVPGALEAAEGLYSALGMPEQARSSRTLREGWRDVEELFVVEAPGADVRANVASYARTTEVQDASEQIEPEPDGQFRYYAIALDREGRPLPVLHTDHGFVMEYTNPDEDYLRRAARTIATDFPAGLMSPVGVMVANPALAPEDAQVVDPRDLMDPADDQPVPLRSIFTSSHYHGAVVWSWQQALLASGIRRQLERTDLSAETRDTLMDAECKLWRTIESAESVRAGELWSWAPGADGQPEYRAFGFNRADVDESNAVQLWSTVYLVVKEPTEEENGRCGGGGGE